MILYTILNINEIEQPIWNHKRFVIKMGLSILLHLHLYLEEKKNVYEMLQHHIFCI